MEHCKSQIKTMDLERQTIENREFGKKFRQVIYDHRTKLEELERTLYRIQMDERYKLATNVIPTKDAVESGIKHLENAEQAQKKNPLNNLISNITNMFKEEKQDESKFKQ
eukprot:204086_1